jgi:hypothetical protein
VRDGVVVRLAKELPTGAVHPEELIRYALGQEPQLSAILERAVRVDPESYAEALDLLAGREGEFSPTALQGMVPALAWLTGTSGMVANGEEWREWLRGRLSAREGGGNLDLPERPNR